MTTSAAPAETLDDLRARHRRDYDPYAAWSIQEHMDEIAERRDVLPISYSARGNGCWVLTRYDDISSVLRRNNRGFVSFPNEPDGINAMGSEIQQIPIETDGALHKQFRQLLDPYFSPKRVEALTDQLTGWANRLIDDWVEDGECDFVDGFALPFPGATVLTIMGWPAEDLHRMNHWASTLMHGVVGGTAEETAAARAVAHGELRDYWFAMIAERRASGHLDDVTSAAIEAEIDGERLTDTQLFDLFLLMMAAGLDTVQSVLCQSMVYLAAHPEKWDAMFATPESLEPAIEELLRWCAPAVPTRNVVHEEVEVAGLVLPKGERVHFPLAAANRDPAYYPDPDEVIFDRAAKPHLAFGLGTHRCVGLHLARLELKIAFTQLRRRLPSFALHPDYTPREHLGLAWGVDNVRLTFVPGARETEGSR
ncbi:cytochrome P450 [Nocardioides zeae]|uniref:Cytochrome P450 n=1 Tax=Nocardioides imazamoxiresistens TaxID=3231893 RepID=A0ABU3PSG8_9ACTN|nr:cytochrome P450 [Nocardioides zeae]MDT9592136.1 cytochrome P450 [Nocardioides zeae]